MYSEQAEEKLIKRNTGIVDTKMSVIKPSDANLKTNYC